MASDAAIKKMIQAIIDKRRELGLLDWGVVPPEEVIRRINRKGNHDRIAAQSLEKDEEARQNKPRSLLDILKRK